MVNFKKFLSSLQMTKAMNGLTSGPDLDMLLRSANDGWGFSDGTGTIDGTNGFWVDAGTPKVGSMNVSDFMKLSDKAKFDFINSDAFPTDVRTRMSGKIDSNFTSDFQAVREKGLPSRRAAEADYMDGNTVKPAQVGNFQVFMDKFSVKMALGGAAGVWGLVELIKLAEAQSGCFLVGPEGQEEKVSAGDCSCEGGVGNPNAGACCSACNTTGDSFLCAGGVSDEDPPPPNYTCPSETVVAGRARQFARTSISAQAAKARDRAVNIASSKVPVSASENTTLKDGCVSCGCTELWTLCHREVSIFDAIGDLLASLGDIIEQTVDGLLNIVKAALGEILSVVKMVMIIVGVAVAAAIVIGVTVVVVKKLKKKKLRNS
jgi:hypothetical protein